MKTFSYIYMHLFSSHHYNLVKADLEIFYHLTFIKPSIFSSQEFNIFINKEA